MAIKYFKNELELCCVVCTQDLIKMKPSVELPRTSTNIISDGSILVKFWRPLVRFSFFLCGFPELLAKMSACEAVILQKQIHPFLYVFECCCNIRKFTYSVVSLTSKYPQFLVINKSFDYFFNRCFISLDRLWLSVMETISTMKLQ